LGAKKEEVVSVFIETVPEMNGCQNYFSSIDLILK